MDPRLYPFWEAQPLEELEPGLRQTVECLRREPIPGAALELALQRAGMIPLQTRVRRPWLRRPLVVRAAAVAAALLIVLGLWAVLSRIPLVDETDAKRLAGFEIGITKGPTNDDRELLNVNATTKELDYQDPSIPPVNQGRPSTFPVTLQPTSYQMVRRCLLQDQQLPAPAAVRVDELINAFPCRSSAPLDQNPLAYGLALVECPWDSGHHLLRIWLRADGGPGLARQLAARVEIAFNPRRVAGYRRLDNELRLVKTETMPAEREREVNLEAGQSVSVLYEIVPAGSNAGLAEEQGDWLTLKLRYKDARDAGKLLTQTLAGKAVTLAEAGEDMRFLAAVAEFGLLLRQEENRGQASFAGCRDLAAKALGSDADGRRAEFLKLVDAAESLTRKQQGGAKNK